MKFYISLFLIAIFAASSLFSQEEPTDTDANGLLNVSNLNHLRWISENHHSWRYGFELDNNINAMDTKNWNDGRGFKSIGMSEYPFRGYFDGKGYAIRNLYINTPNDSCVGFFGCTDSSRVQNLHIKNCNITGGQTVGAMSGICQRSDIDSCTASGEVQGTRRVGGLIGSADRARLRDCDYGGDVKCDSTGGGLVGNCDSCLVRNCHANCNMNASGNNVGGLFGKSHSDIDSCSSSGNIKGGSRAGGLIGYGKKNSLKNSNSRANVECDSTGGGLVGECNSCQIRNCHSNCNVTVSGNNAGGFAGKSNSDIDSCSSNGEVRGNKNVGGFVGECDSTIAHSHSSSRVEASGNNAGGFTGRNRGQIRNCSSTGDCDGDESVGGFSGENEGKIQNAYSRGMVAGNGLMGGIVGDNTEKGTVDYCYATGEINAKKPGQNFGGVVGRNSNSEAGFDNNFWDTQTSKKQSSKWGKGKTSSEMKDPGIYLEAGWDFEDIWALDATTNDGYPYFSDGLTAVKDEENNEIKILVYPNPAYSILNIEANKLQKIVIYDLNGSVLKITNSNQIDIENLPTGLYFMTLTIENKIYHKKFIKE
ncbi:MAG: hypothetical protein B7C24_10380 [Bacteroidetes bacterium 4572_77]|nr:MAG: hypothetical protein B7C24_10380 [Bacteroidetes bacterium 4572_77]